MQRKKWIILTSRSGKTATEVEKLLGIKADLRFSTTDDKHAYIMDKLRSIDPTNVLITAMGYMRIIDADICEKFEIYNLHPGDIIKHPWLKGKDPIERFFASKTDTGVLQELGSVIHKVTPEVDEGEVVRRKTYIASSVESAYNNSFMINCLMWQEVLQERLWQK